MQRNIQPLLTIIIPVYNADEYLGKCVKSVLSQNYKNIEVIIVDNGSTDRSSEICHGFANSDKRVRLMCQKKRGASASRNLALSHSKGDFITFVDADDEILPDTYKLFIPWMATYNLDIISYSYTRNKNAHTPLRFSDARLDILDNTPEIIKYYLNDNLFSNGYVWNKIFRNTCISKVRFKDNIHITEDKLFVFNCLLNAHRLGVTPEIGYIYNQTPHSQTSSKLSKKVYDIVVVSEEIYRRVQLLYPDILGCARECLLNDLLITYRSSLLLEGSHSSTSSRFYRSRLLDIGRPQTLFSNKLHYYFIKLRPSLYCKIYTTYHKQRKG